jgi:hypothetical protein
MAAPPPSGSCTRAANLVITWTHTSPVPVNGYIIRYRPVKIPPFSGWLTTSTTSNFISIEVSACFDYEVEVEADCGVITSSIVSTTADRPPSIVYVSTTAPGVSMTNITGISGYIFDGPLLAGSAQQDEGSVHNGFGTGITVTLSGSAVIASNLRLYKNEVQQQCLPVPSGAGAAGTYSFSPVTFSLGDECRISLSTGNC